MPKKLSARRLLAGCSIVGALSFATGCQSVDTKRASDGAGTAIKHPAASTAKEQAGISPQAALERLRAGNARFVAGKSELRNLPAQIRATAAGQYPYAVVLSCLDSRQPIELILDQGIGDIFNARVAGNVLTDEILGSLEFACKASGAKLILVMGHSNCGAVKGAIDNVELGRLTGLLNRIKPAMADVPADGQPRTSKNTEFVQKVAEANVRLVERQIREQSPILREMLDNGTIGMTGAMYDLETGDVKFLPAEVK